MPEAPTLGTLFHDKSLEESGEQKLGKTTRGPIRKIGLGIAGISGITIIAALVAVPFIQGYHPLDFDFFDTDPAPDTPPTPEPGSPGTPLPTAPDLPPVAAPTIGEPPIADAPIPADQGPQSADGSDTSATPAQPEVEAKAPELKSKFVSDDTYETAKLNLGGADTDGDGVTDKGGIAGPARIEDPTQGNVDALRKASGLNLSAEDASLALQKGGYTKNGVTYEIWESRAHPGTYYTTAVNASHDLVGKVVTVDQPSVPTVTSS